jgi:hypothetical protein
VAAGALALYVLFRMLSRGKIASSFGVKNPFICRIDPRAPPEVKQKEALDSVVEYINNTFKGQALKPNSSGLF